MIVGRPRNGVWGPPASFLRGAGRRPPRWRRTAQERIDLGLWSPHGGAQTRRNDAA